MNRLKFAVFAVCMGAIAAPAYSQLGGYDGVEFVEAVKKSDGSKVMELINKDGAGIVNAKDGSGNTALIFAIGDRNEDYTAFLLNQGADPNLPGKDGDTPLIAAARIGYEPDSLREFGFRRHEDRRFAALDRAQLAPGSGAIDDRDRPRLIMRHCLLGATADEG